MNNIELSNKLKLLCKQRKLPIKSLLESANINRNFIYDLEHKEAAPAADKLERIADQLDCSVDYLLGRTDNPHSHHTPASTTLNILDLESRSQEYAADHQNAAAE